MRSLLKFALPVLVLTMGIFGLLIGCGPDLEGTGSIHIGLAPSYAGEARNIMPPEAIEAVSYRLEVEGNTEGVVYDDIVTGDHTLVGLQPNTYTARAWAYNAAGGLGIEIGYGEDSIVLERGDDVQLAITVAEYEASPGTIDLELNWSPDVITNIVMASEIAYGTAAPVDVSADWVITDPNGQATYLNAAAPVGWATMIARLHDGDVLQPQSTGFVELIRVAQGQTSAGIIDVTASAATSGLEILLDFSGYEELPLTFDHTEGEVQLNGDEDFLASTDGGETATFVWYENGSQVQVDLDVASTYTFPFADYQLDQVVRLDLVAITADGMMAGQGTWRVTLSDTVSTITIGYDASTLATTLYLYPPGGSYTTPSYSFSVPTGTGYCEWTTPGLAPGDYMLMLRDTAENFGKYWPVGAPAPVAWTLPGPAAVATPFSSSF